MLHISVFAFFDWVSLAFVSGLGVGAWFYGKVFNWKYQKLVKKAQLENPDDHAVFQVRSSLDSIEAALLACEHPYHADGYCITCGARKIGGAWCAPDWRDLLVNAHKLIVGDLGTIRGRIGKPS